MKILPDGTIAIKAHPAKAEQCRCGICGRKSVHYDNGRGGIVPWARHKSRFTKEFIGKSSYPFTWPRAFVT